MNGFLKMIRRYVSPYRGHLAGSIALNLLSVVFNVFSFSMIMPILKMLFSIDDTVYEFVPWGEVSGSQDIIGNLYYAVAQMTGTYGASRVLLWLCLFLCVMTVLKTACYFGAAAVMIPIRTGVVKDIRQDIYDKLLTLPVGYFSEERKGDIMARMSGDVQEVETSITGSLDMLIKSPILIVGYFAVLLFVSWQMTLFTVLFAPLMIWVMGRIGHALKAKSLEAQALWSSVMSQIEETLGGLRVIKASLAEKMMSARFDSLTQKMKRKNSRVATRQALAHPVSECLGTIMIAVVLWFGGTLILGDHAPFDAPTFIFFLVMLYSVIQPIKDLTKAAYGIPKGMASMERINAILDAPDTIPESGSPKRIASLSEGVRFERVGFAYGGSAEEVLSGIDLDIPKGATVAIVGPSGAGKSTLADLLPRFHDVTEGSVTIDGIDIRDLSIKDLRSLIGLVQQDPLLFNDSIFANISFGIPGATREQVEAAAKAANAHDFIMEKPGGYDENVGDRGCKLSGGQRQRICIARAILRNPEILILDEATSALDTESEKSVQDALDRLMSGRTTIAIAHRLSTVRHADRIIVLEGGRITEQGRHEELLALGGTYRKLYEMQSL